MPLGDDHRELFCCQDRVTGEEIIRLGVTRGFCEHLSDSEKVCQVPSVRSDNFKHLGQYCMIPSEILFLNFCRNFCCCISEPKITGHNICTLTSAIVLLYYRVIVYRPCLSGFSLFLV